MALVNTYLVKATGDAAIDTITPSAHIADANTNASLASWSDVKAAVDAHGVIINSLIAVLEAHHLTNTA